MNLEQIDAIINEAEVPREQPNMMWAGEEVFDRLQAILRLKADSVGDIYQPSKTKKLILPAFSYRDIIIVRSPVIPKDCIMLGCLDKLEMEYQKDLIGWK